jgi:hypothetical protein
MNQLKRNLLNQIEISVGGNCFVYILYGFIIVFVLFFSPNSQVSDADRKIQEIMDRVMSRASAVLSKYASAQSLRLLNGSVRINTCSVCKITQ